MHVASPRATVNGGNGKRNRKAETETESGKWKWSSAYYTSILAPPIHSSSCVFARGYAGTRSLPDYVAKERVKVALDL